MNNAAELVKSIQKLKKSRISSLVTKNIKEFASVAKKPSYACFNELCFCILTANFNAKGSIKIQKEIGRGFLSLNKKELAKRLKELGHRFPNTRADYIVVSRKYKDTLKEIIFSFDNEHEVREWLVENIKGLGYKEASHFLRNIGYKNLAIIDFHIVDLLVGCGLVKRPKTLTKKRYIEIEKVLERLAKKTGLTLAELDLYLWYMETGKILK